ncbi:MAG: hypothetical protein LBS36_07560 [Oscillospiraceae bacterium]|nr:hypothetical protein [Oscillospiraceae bacterium]
MNPKAIKEVRTEAESFLGKEITDAEWNSAFPMAQRKLDCIIQRFGDANGERRQAYYLGRLVGENIRESAFSAYFEALARTKEKGRSQEETTQIMTNQLYTTVSGDVNPAIFREEEAS